MSDPPVQQAVADDGTTIVGSVQGQGPPLVLVPSVPADGALELGPLVPHLCERFTCYVMDRGSRARNAEEQDHSLERIVGDVVSFIDSVGDPVGLLGVSFSGMLALGAARRTSAVSALGLWEPTVIEAASEQDRARVNRAIDDVGALVDEGRLADAARSFSAASGFFTEEQLAAIPDEAWEALAPVTAIQVEEYRQAGQSPGPTPTDPSELAALTVPVLLMHGAETMPWFMNGVDHVAGHVTDATVRSIPGVGHGGLISAPAVLAVVAEELVRLFTAVLDPT